MFNHAIKKSKGIKVVEQSCASVLWKNIVFKIDIAYGLKIVGDDPDGSY